MAVCAVPEEESFINNPLDLALSSNSATAVAVAVTVPTVPVVFCVATNKEPFVVPTVAIEPMLSAPAALCADATGADATDNIPANNALTAVSAMRLRIVVFDIFFLSLVRNRNFLILARRPFGSSNSISWWHTRVMPLRDGNLVIQ